MSGWDDAGVPDADGHELPVGLLNAERFYAAAQALGDLRCPVNPRAGEYRDELISAIAGDEITGTIHGAGNRRADLLETFVTGGVSFGIVIGLESIDVEHDQR